MRSMGDNIQDVFYKLAIGLVTPSINAPRPGHFWHVRNYLRAFDAA